MPELYRFQKQAVAELLAGKHIIVSSCGSGKSAMAMTWAEQKCKETGKHRVLVVTTASKCKARNDNGDDDFTADARIFCSLSFSESLSSSLSLISWYKLRAWVDANWKTLDKYVVVADEVAKCKGYTTGMGRAFLRIAKKNPDWAGFTGTPGDSWDAYIGYFVATNLVRNKTSFMARYANVQTYKGYPEIVGWRNEDRLHDMWARISYAPDASEALQELPKTTKRVFTFSLPKTYSMVLKTRLRAGSDGSNPDEDFLETPGALTSELRRICFTKDKQEWVKDFVEGLDTGAVMFYNFIATGDKLEEIITKVLPRGARVWRIDGKHHEIPTAETAGKRDIVLCQWQSGSEALNLQFYWHLVMVELPYSYSTLTQGMGRIQRLGQTHPTFFYTLLCEKGIEQDVRATLKTKHDFAIKEWCINNNIEVEEDDGKKKQNSRQGI